MNKFLFILFFLLPTIALADFTAGFSGSRYDGHIRESTVFEWRGIVDANNVTKDTAGNNLLLYSEENNEADWVKSDVTVTADQVYGPKESFADLLTPGAADSYIYQDVTTAVGKYTCSFYLRSVTGAVNLSIHVYSETHTAIRATKAITLSTNWNRYSVQGDLVAGDTDVGCTIGGNSTWSTGENIYSVRAQVQMNDQWRRGPGIYHRTQSFNIPNWDGTDTNDPSEATVSLQNKGGNRQLAREFDGTNCYSLISHASMNVCGTDCVISAVVKTTGSGDYVFSHISASTGLGLIMDATSWYVSMESGTGELQVWNDTVDPQDSKEAVLQFVRDNNSCTLYVNGVAGTTEDCTGKATDSVSNFTIGANFDCSVTLYEGKISYLRFDTEAKSVDEILAEKEDLINGGIGLRSNNWSFDFERTTEAKLDFSNSWSASTFAPSLANISVGLMRVGGKGAGVLVEAASTNYADESEEINLWTEVGTCAVTANDTYAPDGTLTADLVDNTGGANTDNRNELGSNYGDLTGVTCTASIWHRADIPHIFTIRVQEPGAAPSTRFTTSPYAINEWQRFEESFISLGGGVGNFNFRVWPGELAVATGIMHIWGAQIECDKSYATSYIGPTASAAITRTADDLTFDLHEDDINRKSLPVVFCDTCSARALTIYFEAKGLWSSNADMDDTKYMVSISGNGGVAALNRNRVTIYGQTTGKIWFLLRSDDAAQYFVNSTVNVVDYDDWFSVRAVIDFEDLDNMDLWINEDNTGFVYSATGTATLDTTDNLLRIGQRNTGAVSGDVRIRNLRITPTIINAP